VSTRTRLASEKAHEAKSASLSTTDDFHLSPYHVASERKE
jgi:hypothetical protein